METLRRVFRAFIDTIGDAICMVLEPLGDLVDEIETKNNNNDKLVVVVKQKTKSNKQR